MSWRAVHRSMHLARSAILYSTIIFAVITSCSPPANREEAINQVIGQGFLRPDPNSGGMSNGIRLLIEGTVSESQTPCEGAIGSVLPPFSLEQCGLYSIVRPFIAVEDALSNLTGARNPLDRRHIYLTGIEKFWVHQSEPDDCWAATIEVARKYLNLRYVSQDELLSTAHNACPRLRESKGADAYEIVSVIRFKLKQYDQTRVQPGACFNIECIITQLTTGHPVIMLGSGHAVLMIGMDYIIIPSNQRKSGPSIVVERAYVLDPNGTGQVETWSIGLCKIDTFLFY
jgi:hypothetical protein